MTTSKSAGNFIGKSVVRCILKEKCGLKFDIILTKNPSKDTVIVDIFWNGFCYHERVRRKNFRLTGKKRRAMAFRLFTYGANRVRTESIIIAEKNKKKSKFSKRL